MKQSYAKLQKSNRKSADIHHNNPIHNSTLSSSNTIVDGISLLMILSKIVWVSFLKVYFNSGLNNYDVFANNSRFAAIIWEESLIIHYLSILIINCCFFFSLSESEISCYYVMRFWSTDSVYVLIIFINYKSPTNLWF